MRKCEIYEERATSVKSSANFSDVMPGRSTRRNTAEDRIIAFADVSKKLRETDKQYKEMRGQVETALDSLLYWQASLIYHFYIYNPLFEYDEAITGAGYITGTKDRRQIRTKLDAAKEALADVLIAQGVDIEK